jgi:electron transfer flavoprotein-quinone oxidoreductase
MEKIDVVIVGAGLSGLSCAHRLADAGLQVVVVERGDFPGSKNVTGGRLYMMPLRKIAGDMLEGAPMERKVVRERWSLLGQDNSLNIDLTSRRLREEGHSYTVLRSRLDRWLSEKVMEKGVFVIPKYRVDDLLWEGEQVAGIRAGSEEIWAHVVVAADGALSFMAEKAGLKGRTQPASYAVGVKEVIELPAGKVNDRFNVEEGEGVAQLFLGDVTQGIFGGGFLYTNRESISLGIVVGIKALMERSPDMEVPSLMEAFRKRYEIERLIEGGSLAEYSAHIIPEAGYEGLSKLYGKGIIVAGDAAGFTLNMGVTVRGMEFAVASGMIAAETILEAKTSDDFSEQSLSAYERRLKESFVIKDMEQARRMPAFLDQEDFFSQYPRTFPDLVEKIMWFGEEPKERLGKTIWQGLKSSGMLQFKRLKQLYDMKNI